MSEEEIRQLTDFQINEITEHRIYSRLAALQKNSHNRQVLSELAKEELTHFYTLKKYTGKTPAPQLWKVNRYVWIARLFGLTFGIKLMEKGEDIAQKVYRQWKNEDIQKMATEEEVHEAKLISLIDEEGLNYMSSVVLGLNDALVEFTGALVGYTFALQHPHLVALTGGITGIAAALSMAASEYLSTRAEKENKNAFKASIYTGIAYIITVIVLIAPFVFMKNVYWALGVCLTGALVIIAVFNYYYSIVRSESFKKRFGEMALISLGIAAISFGIGYALRLFTGIEL